MNTKTKSGADIPVCDYHAMNTDRNVCATLNAPASKIRNRLLRLTADSPELLAVIKNEGKV